MSDEEEIELKKKKCEAPPRRRPKKLVIPRRAPSVVIPERQIVYTTADKTTCAECTCFPEEDPYKRPKKLNPCQHSPLTLYELAIEVVDGLSFPPAFGWSDEDVAQWCEQLQLPQYRDCILDNHINGMRLLMLEDPSKLPDINIHNFEHIQMITSGVRKEYGMDFIRFARSIGLPPRRPLPHCTWFKSRTGPSWGIRTNWTRGDILRWMKIFMPAPIYRDHWELVWYQRPDFPCVKFARVSKPNSQVHIPRYKKPKEVCKEYQIPRKFKLQSGICEQDQMIWVEHRPGSPLKEEIQEEKRKNKVKKKREEKFLMPEGSRLFPEKVKCEGLSGDALVLARRKMAKHKFLP